MPMCHFSHIVVASTHSTSLLIVVPMVAALLRAVASTERIVLICKIWSEMLDLRGRLLMEVVVSWLEVCRGHRSLLLLIDCILIMLGLTRSDLLVKAHRLLFGVVWREVSKSVGHFDRRSVVFGGLLDCLAVLADHTSL